MAGKSGYVLLVQYNANEDAPVWNGKRIKVTPDADTGMSLNYMQVRLRIVVELSTLFQVDGIYLVVVNSGNLKSMRASLQRNIDDSYLELVDEQCSCHEIIAHDMLQLKVEYDIMLIL